MSAEEAAGWVTRAIRRRPTRIAPPWLPLAEILHAAAPTVVSRLIGRFSMRRSQP